MRRSHIVGQVGGGVDVDARKLAAIGERITGAKFVVKNKTGAGGLVAMKYILERPADGYILFSATESVVFKTVIAKSDIDLGAFEWPATTQSDPQAIITNREADVHTWEQVVADAKAKGGPRIWGGPAAGGLAHVMAMKIWKAAAFSKAPPFRELGVKGLDNEIMWRGFAVMKGIPEDARKFYADPFAKLQTDSEWRDHVAKMSIDPVYYGPKKFYEVVKKDRVEVTRWATDAGLLKPTK